jgi:hypothetical protein
MTYKMERGFKENFSAELTEVLYDLNRIVIASGEKMEGCLFYGNYKHFEGENAEVPFEGSFHKRYNLLNATRGKKHILEIGMNAGHSAGFVLECNRKIKFTSIDIAEHGYTEKCAEYLKERYKQRFRFIKGDSTQVFPAKYSDLFDVDLIHIDGGHGKDLFNIDLTHAVFLPNTSGCVRHIVVDDTRSAAIRERIIEFINRGFLVTENYNNHWQGFGNMLLRVTYPQ